jgi:hypothetical protein
MLPSEDPWRFLASRLVLPRERKPFLLRRVCPSTSLGPIPGRSTWVLDRGFVAKGTVVPQTLWAPHTITDKRQHVTDAELQMPIYFEGLDGTLGLSLEAAASGRCHGLVDAQEFAPLGFKATTHFRIGVSAMICCHISIH